MILLFHSPDKNGIIATISDFFFVHKSPIKTLEQYTEQGVIFMRIETCEVGHWPDETAFHNDFLPIQKKFQGTVAVHFPEKTQSLGLFISREPHTLLETLNKVELHEFRNIKIPFIVSNHDDDTIPKRYGIPYFFIPTKNNPDYEQQQLEIIQKHKPDFIGLARYMKVLSKDFIDHAGCPIVNIHHSFLPSFVGAKPYEMAYEKGVKLIGATSHFVIPALDQGPIIEQDVTRIRSGYSVEKIKRIGRDTEKRVFVQALKKVLEHKVIVYQNRTIIFE